jgi:hypothetical protein
VTQPTQGPNDADATYIAVVCGLGWEEEGRVIGAERADPARGVAPLPAESVAGTSARLHANLWATQPSR